MKTKFTYLSTNLYHLTFSKEGLVPMLFLEIIAEADFKIGDITQIDGGFKVEIHESLNILNTICSYIENNK